MSHFPVLVLIEGDRDQLSVEDEVERLLAPYDENGEWFRDNSRWDWYQIGGRFTGLLDGYDPATNPENLEPCQWCEATGITTKAVGDKYPAYKSNVGKTCIQCDGKGQLVKWPTQFVKHEGDAAPVSSIDLDKMNGGPTAIVTPDGEWHEEGRVGWFGVMLPSEEGEESKSEDEWNAEVRELLAKHQEAIAVVVDCHV